MPRKPPNKDAPEFGRRLTALMETVLDQRRGAGKYLADRYKVSTVTANAWLKGEHLAAPALAKRIADDHGSTFDELYWGKRNPEDAIREEPASYGEHVDLMEETRQLTTAMIALFEWIQETRPVEAPLLAEGLAKMTDQQRAFGKTGTLDLLLESLGLHAVDVGRKARQANARKKSPSDHP